MGTLTWHAPSEEEIGDLNATSGHRSALVLESPADDLGLSRPVDGDDRREDDAFIRLVVLARLCCCSPPLVVVEVVVVVIEVGVVVEIGIFVTAVIVIDVASQDAAES